MTSILIRNGRIFDPSTKRDEVGALLIIDGKIAEVGGDIAAREGVEVIDAGGRLLVPGLIDIHTHLREPGREDKETIQTGTRAAAAGGYTTVCCIPNTNPVIDSQTGLKFILARAETEACVNVYPYAAVTKGQLGDEIVEFGDLVYYGAVGFTDDGHPVMNSEIMRRALEYSAMFNVPILDHCEDKHLSDCGVMHEGFFSTKLGLKGIPSVAESIQVARDVDLAQYTGGHIHICHISKKESLDHVRRGKAKGVRITCEVTPHHLTLTDEAVKDFDTAAKVNPPIGSEQDREELIKGLIDGTIDCIATDHAPHTDIEKDAPITDAPFGMIGLETGFALMYTHLVLTGRISLEFLVEKMTTAPAKIVHLEPRGTLSLGAPGDVTIIDLEQELVIEDNFFYSKSRNSPFYGHKIKGIVQTTIVGGRPVFQDRKLMC